MANQIPLNTLTTAAGGALVPLELGDLLVQGFNRQSAAMQLVGQERISTNRMTWPVYLGRPTAGFVGEGAAKPITGAEYSELSVAIKKIATFVVYTQELLEDARVDPQVLINQDVEGAFADLVDSNIVGTHAGDTTATHSTNFDAALANTSQNVELGTSGDAMAVAISNAMATLEANGYAADGILAALDVKGHLRDARQGGDATAPLYTQGFNGAPDSIYGLNIAYTTNLDGFPAGLRGGAGSPAKTAAIVGAFRSNGKAVIRRDLGMGVFREGVVGAHNLLEQNKVAVRWELRMGFQAFDLDRAFVRIINAA